MQVAGAKAVMRGVRRAVVRIRRVVGCILDGGGDCVDVFM